jgi:hypothetical protein
LPLCFFVCLFVFSLSHKDKDKEGERGGEGGRGGRKDGGEKRWRGGENFFGVFFSLSLLGLCRLSVIIFFPSYSFFSLYRLSFFIGLLIFCLFVFRPLFFHLLFYCTLYLILTLPLPLPLPYLTLPYLTLPYLTLPYLTLTHNLTLTLTLSYLTLPYPYLTLTLTLPYLTLP